MLTLAPAICWSSMSLIVSAPSITTAAPPSVKLGVAAAVTTGASLTAVRLSKTLATSLRAAPAPSLLASVNCQLMTRSAVSAVGSVPVLKLTLRSAAWYWATLAVPVSASTPVVAS